MSVASPGKNRIEFSNPEFGNPEAYSGLHAISPMLIGFSLPCIAVVWLAPPSLVGLRALVTMLLVVVALAATIVFALSVFASGRIAAVVFDAQSRAVELVSTGTFARRTEKIPFADVATIRATTRYDRDGYKSVSTELVLKSGESIPLPVMPSETEMRSARAMLAVR